MNFVKIFALLLFIQSYIRVYDKEEINKKIYEELKKMMMKKIEKKEYVEFNSSEEFIKVHIYLNEENHILNINIENIKTPEANASIEKFEFHYDDKSINEITEYIEFYVEQYSQKKNNDSIILVYDSECFEACPILKDVIKHIKSINENRKINNKCWGEYYNYICATDCYLLKMLMGIKCGIVLNEYDISIFDFHFYYISKYNDRCIRFYIKKGELCYLFELNIEELNIDALISLNDTNIKLNSDFDGIIINKLLILCKLSDMDDIEKYETTTEYIFTPNMINIPEFNFKLVMESNKISFNLSSGTYEYFIMNKSINEDCKLYIEEKKFLDVKFFFENTPITQNVLDDFKAVELLFRIFRNNNKIEFLITKIFKNKGSGLNLICAHLLLSMEIINQNDHNLLLRGNEESENEVISRCMDIIKKNYLIINGLQFYLFKKCLLMEAAKFVCENNVEDDLVYKTLKEIYHLNEKKNVTNIIDLSTKKEDIYFLKTIQEAILTYKDHIRYYKYSILSHLCRISFMFIEMDDFFGNAYEQYKHQKDKFIHFLKLDKNEVDKNTKIIMNNLSKNTMIEYKYQEKRKQKKKTFQKLKEIFDKYLLGEELSKIIENSQNLDIKNIYMEKIRSNLENNLISEGIQKIEAAFYNYKLIKEEKYFGQISIELKKLMFSVSLNEEEVFEYKIKQEDCFKKKIYIVLKNKTIEAGKTELLKIFKILFNSFFEKDTSKREKNEKYLETIKLVLKRQQLEDFINEELGLDLHSELVKVLKMYDQTE
ncbi:uncharacterized protein VNE69_06076 [Vairimorpha necatrix]|uniref:Uncharacterized protein n=1 Tax=Vairimorpha necatrix TaxID=6039 RepID=A0AAX4JCM6_9MICR